MPITARGAIARQPGAPVSIEEFTIDDPGQNEVLVRILASGVCHTDLGYFYDGVPMRHALPLTLGHEISGVVVGLMHFSLGFGVLMLYSVIQTIPRSLEEAARVHGAPRRRMFWRVVLPLSLPGVIIGALMIFNMCMGAFTSAALHAPQRSALSSRPTR